MTNSINGLSQTYTMLIDSIMSYERQPLNTMNAQKSALSVRRGALLDLSNKLNSLQTAVRSLKSGDAYSVLTLGRSVKVTPDVSGATVATATASSSAIPGSYELNVTKLARAQRYTSTPQSGPRVALGKQGSLWFGGTGEAAVSADPSTTVSGAVLSGVADGQRELGSGTYRVQTRESDGVKQFRLVDADGAAVQVADLAAGGSALTAGWQTLTAGEFDTRRGLTLTFSGETGVDAELSYTAAGAEVKVDSSDSLVTIAGKINNALQPTGRDAVASVVGSQLILTAAQTGTDHTISFTDSSDLLGFGAATQTAQNAEFSVNGVHFSRNSNTDLKDVVNGMTLNLAKDAEGKSATIEVANDHSNTTAGIQTFIDKFNEVTGYIAAKTAITKNADNTFTRGVLADDLTFQDLRDKLFETLMGQSNTSSSFHSLRDLGISMDNSLKLSVTDSSKLEAALNSKYEDATSFLNDVMGKLHTQLGSYTRSDGYVASVIKNLDGQSSDLTYSIQQFEARMTERQSQLVQQYGEMQALLLSMSYQQQTITSIFGTTSNLV